MATSMKSACRKIRLSIVIPAGSFAGKVVQHPVQFRGQLQRVGARLLLNPENHRGLSSGGSLAALRFLPDDDLTDIGHLHGNSVPRHDDGVPDVLERTNPAHSGNEPLGAAVIDEACRHVLIALRQGAHHLAERQTVRLELGRGEQDLELFDPATDRRDLRHAGHRENAPPYHRVRGGSQLDGCVLVRGQ
jgi:hypothetical protein